MTEIGATLREARMRRHIDITEVESATKIRAKYLRAMEDEEWHLLPGPTFVKSFLRTYADYLGLDSRLLIEQWKRNNERVTEAELPPLAPPGSSGRSAPRPPGRWRGIVLGLCVLIIILGGLFVLGKWTDDSNPPSAPATSTTKKKAAAKPKKKKAKPAATTVKLKIGATAPVYVCLVDGSNKKLIPGLTLQPGAAARSFSAKRFRLNMGNASATLTVNGKRVPLQASGTGIGLAITPKGRKTLPQGQRPTCA
jgi:cytoskeleton protein RodZ